MIDPLVLLPVVVLCTDALCLPGLGTCFSSVRWLPRATDGATAAATAATAGGHSSGGGGWPARSGWRRRRGSRGNGCRGGARVAAIRGARCRWRGAGGSRGGSHHGEAALRLRVLGLHTEHSPEFRSTRLGVAHRLESTGTPQQDLNVKTSSCPLHGVRWSEARLADTTPHCREVSVQVVLLELLPLLCQLLLPLDLSLLLVHFQLFGVFF
mmetsp:Transcript_102183/g.256149  ORF Transcript_102183/g.256149 Transcript_102183/m.256149 type:complete len:211 (-) Transcript_102183:2101-2733(-)